MADHATLGVEARQAEVAFRALLSWPALTHPARDNQRSTVLDHLLTRRARQIKLFTWYELTSIPVREHPHPRGRIVAALRQKRLTRAERSRKFLHQDGKRVAST